MVKNLMLELYTRNSIEHTFADFKADFEKEAVMIAIKADSAILRA